MKASLKTLFAATILVAAVPAANAVTYTFSRITSNASTDIASQLTMDVTSGVGYVEFKFINNIGFASNLTEIYVDDGSPVAGRRLGTASVAAQSGATFSFLNNLNPNNLPSGSTVNFNATAALSVDSDQTGGGSDGLNTSSDYVTLRYGLGDYADLSGVLAALDAPDSNGALRFGLHVRSIGGQSDSFVNVPNPPDPGPTPVADGGSTMLLLGAGLVGLGLARRK